MDIETNHIYDKMNQCISLQTPTFTDFMDLGVRKRFTASMPKTTGIIVIEYKGFLDDERRMIGFIPSEYASYMNDEAMLELFPINYLVIEPAMYERAVFSHRDILGSVLGLGLERRLFGDIILDEQKAFLLCQERISHVVISELFQVRQAKVNVSICSDIMPLKLLAPNSMELKTTVASLRLDVIIKSILSMSRTNVNELIERGNVKVNQIEIAKNHKQLEAGDILSIRYKGKYKISTIGLENKKGRIAITILKYI